MLRQSSNTGRRTSIDRRERIVDLSKTGKFTREIANINNREIHGKWFYKKISEKGLENQLRSGKPWKTTRRIGQLIKRKSAVDIKKTASEIAQELHEEELANISHSTIIRHLDIYTK